MFLAFHRHFVFNSLHFVPSPRISSHPFPSSHLKSRHIVLSWFKAHGPVAHGSRSKRRLVGNDATRSRNTSLCSTMIERCVRARDAPCDCSEYDARLEYVRRPHIALTDMRPCQLPANCQVQMVASSSCPSYRPHLKLRATCSKLGRTCRHETRTSWPNSRRLV